MIRTTLSVTLVFALQWFNASVLHAAEIVSTLADQEEVAVTIYNDDFALVRDRRLVNVPMGTIALAMQEVSAQIRPETTMLRNISHPDGFKVLEQSFDFDLLTPTKLLEKYVGKEVLVVRTHPQTGLDQTMTAKVLSASEGVVLKVEGQIETGFPGRLVFPVLPPSLRDRPTLVVELESNAAARQQLELSYLTTGLNWQADYVVALSANEKDLDFSGWVSLTNSSGVDFQNAHLQFVAGEVNRLHDDLRLQRTSVVQAASARTTTPPMEEEKLFEYHLYTLKRPVTLKNHQTKQVAFLDATGVPIHKEYRLTGASYYYQGRYDNLGEKHNIGVFIEFANRKEFNLGMPIPKGVVRAYKEDQSGQLQFLGEDRIDHTQENKMVRIKAGDSFDVTANRKQTDFRKLSGDSRYNYRFENAFTIDMKNSKDEAVSVTVVEPVPGDWKILEENYPHNKDGANSAIWKVEVPAKGETVLNYRVEVQY